MWSQAEGVVDLNTRIVGAPAGLTLFSAEAISDNGAFMSPRGASRMAGKQGGIASFAVLSGPQGTAQFEFSAVGINFHSEQIDALSVQGRQVQYSGKGSVNGAGVYHFTLTATATAGKNRVRIRIWHDEPGSNAEVTDYDNQRESVAMKTDGQGSVVEEGGISIQQSD